MIPIVYCCKPPQCTFHYCTVCCPPQPASVVMIYCSGMRISFCFSSSISSNKLAPPGIQNGLEGARFLLPDQLAEAGMTFLTSLPFSPQSLRCGLQLITMNQRQTRAEQDLQECNHVFYPTAITAYRQRLHRLPLSNATFCEF